MSSTRHVGSSDAGTPVPAPTRTLRALPSPMAQFFASPGEGWGGGRHGVGAMNLAPIAEAPLAIKIHLATVLPAFAIGTWLIFFSTKGAWWHRRLGAVYLALMMVTAVAAFFIRSIN